MTRTRIPANASAAGSLLSNIERDLVYRLKRTPNGDPVAELMRRARAVVAVGMIPNTVDGYPKTTPGNGNSSGGNGRHIFVVDDETGEQGDRVPVTSTEQAAMNDHHERDIIKEIALDVVTELMMLRQSLESAHHALDRFDALRSTAKINDAPQCHIAKGHGLPWDDTWTPFRLTDLNGQLTEPRRLCKFTYWFHRDHGRLPTKAEMIKHLERGVVRVGT